MFFISLANQPMAVMTGEEDEETVIQVRGKLYALQDGNQWKERGTGIIRLNVKRHDGSNPRLGTLQFTRRLPSPLISHSSDAQRRCLYAST